MSITAHCMVKNEEVFIEPAIRSVIYAVEKILVFDTGSTDTTVEQIIALQKEFPNKIIFEEKGPCDKKRHTQLRQEMIDRTETTWFMILDGDEVWSERGVEEIDVAIKKIEVECVMAPFYLCVGDVYHRYYKKGSIEMLGKKDFWYPRIIKKVRGVHWSGDYNEDTLLDEKGNLFFNKENSFILQSRYWHLTHLRRSSSDDVEYSSGGTRKQKRRETYFFIGRKIQERVPTPLLSSRAISLHESFRNFVRLVFNYL